MTLIDDTETPAPRVGLFYGATIVAAVIGMAAVLGGGTVKPLLDIPALVTQVTEQPPAADPAQVPVEPDVDRSTSAPTSTATDACAVPSGTYATRVCAAAAALGWPLTVNDGGSLREGMAFTALVNLPGEAPGTSEPVPPLVRGQRLAVPDIVGGAVVTFAHQDAGIMTAEVTPLPAQADAGIATAIRTAIGAQEIYFLEGDALADGPDISFGKGWQIATAYDPSRTVGAKFTADSVTLTVTASDEAKGTVYAVA